MYGSNLVSKKDGEHAWLSTSTVLKNALLGNRGHKSIAAKKNNWSADGTVFDSDFFEPTSTLDMFTKPWDLWCASLDTDVVDVRYFLWDWRRPLEEICNKFTQWILKQGLSTDNRAVVASYSTASLFTWPVINEHPELFSGWLNVGGAIGGGNFILNDFAHGWYKDPICLVSAETMFALPSFYSFNAAVGEPTGSAGGQFLFKDPNTMQEVDADSVDLYDIETWRQLKLGKFSQGKEVTEEEVTHMKNSLAAALRFRKAHYVREGKTSFEDPAFLDHPISSYEHLDIVHFGNESHNNTHCGWYFDGKKISIDPKNPIHGNGDGTIMTWAWKFLVGGLPNHRIVHCSNDELTHVQLMADPKVQHTAADLLGIKCTEAVVEKRKGWSDITIQAATALTIGIVTSLLASSGGGIGKGELIFCTLVVAAGFGSSILRWYLHAPSCLKPSSRSAVLITGGARGIGRDTADYLISQGYSVLITVRKQAQYDEMKVAAEQFDTKPYPILLDVTQDDHIPTAVKQLKSFLQKYNKDLVAVVNNAGINPEGEKIADTLQKGQTLDNALADPTSIGSLVFETNVVGVGRVTKACLPFLAQSGKGRVVNIGSYFGSVAGATGLGHCYYEASKFALEGMTDNMRRSLKKEGILVALVKPGNITTEMNKAFGESTTRVVAMDIEHAIASPNPKSRYYPGKVKGYSTKFVCSLYEMLPTWMSDNM
mmetsp:Transcript_19961/g.43275  ORF Transcript_19961/g.43275 Transcript_19961/m.43275 type:complete len:711 (+) Transcript_19961:2-2134(+)